MKPTILGATVVGLLALAVALVPSASGGPGQIRALGPAVAAAAAPPATVVAPEPAPEATSPGQPQGVQDNDSVAVPIPAPAGCASDPANPHVYTSSPAPPAGYCSWLDYASLPHDLDNPPAPYGSWLELMNHPPRLSFVPSGAWFDMNDPSTYPGA